MGSSPATAALAQMESRMLTNFEALERDQQGYSQVNSLFAIIEALRPLPGRKSVVLFSEGVSIPPAVLRLFTGVIDAANRANVSIYTMDAAGLRAESELAKIRDQVNEAAEAWSAVVRIVVKRDWERAIVEGSRAKRGRLAAGSAHRLGELAQDTGGQLFENTNNLRTGFDRLESDLRNYYLLGYTPSQRDLRRQVPDDRGPREATWSDVAARKGYSPCVIRAERP